MSAPGSRPAGEETRTRSVTALERIQGLDAWSTFEKDLKGSLGKVLPVNLPYFHASVFAVRWSNDDMGIATATRTLLDAFESSFGYTTIDYVIETEDAIGNPLTSQECIQDLVYTVREHKAKCRSKPKERPNLMIFYYSGHAGFVNDVYMFAGMLAGEEDDRYMTGPMIRWSELSNAINTENDEDLLVIGDTCYAGTMAIKESPETFGAVARESVASHDLLKCFTARLTELIIEHENSAIAVVTLHKFLVDRMETADMVRTASYYSPHISKRSITLAPLASKEVRALKKIVQPGGKSFINLKCVLDDFAPPPNAAEWNTFLTTNMPKDLRDIEVTYGYKSSSMHYFIRMPLELYYYLPAREAYQFVGRVKEGTRLAPKAITVGPTIPTAQMKETVRDSFDPSTSEGYASRYGGEEPASSGQEQASGGASQGGASQGGFSYAFRSLQ